MSRPSRFNEIQDKMIVRKGGDAQGKRELADLFNCRVSQVTNRRRFLINRDMIEMDNSNHVHHIIRSITNRPSFFEEDLDRLMRGNK